MDPIPSPAEVSISIGIRPVGPSAWVTSSSSLAVSPGAMKRGMEAVTTTGSRTSTSASACPTPASFHAMAMTRTVPLKLGMSKLTRASPSSPTVTGPEWKATSASVGGGACIRTLAVASPPERIAPGSPPPVINRP